jgi:hypothetical protein
MHLLWVRSCPTLPVFSVLESISPTFYERSCANVLVPVTSLTFTSSKKKLCTKLLYKKDAHKMLVKLTPDGKSAHKTLIKLTPGRLTKKHKMVSFWRFLFRSIQFINGVKICNFGFLSFPLQNISASQICHFFSTDAFRVTSLFDKKGLQIDFSEKVKNRERERVILTEAYNK